MILKEIINKSYYGTIGYISSPEDIIKLERYILHNLNILKEYKNIIVATNYSDMELAVGNNKLWQKYFPDCIIINLPKNRGHNFGTADLDNALFNYCKKNNIEWLCKSSNDVILFPDVLDNKIEESDFYYLEGIGYGGLVTYEFNVEKILNNYFFPQTNFYFINVSKTDYLNDEEYINLTYNKIQSISNYNGKIWEYIQDWQCETFLAKCIKRNNLSKHHLLSPEEFIILMDMVKLNNIHDCSHKNIKLKGVCHFHNMNNKIMVLN
tara:strand:+ start:460 stop:1257 length:798 start_codon:yes stop_codon:yes gene_type:complete